MSIVALETAETFLKNDSSCIVPSLNRLKLEKFERETFVELRRNRPRYGDNSYERMVHPRTENGEVTRASDSGAEKVLQFRNEEFSLRISS
mgnify:CR=1 FL=1